MEIIDFSDDFLNDILQIERESFKKPWTCDMFKSSLKNEKIKFKVIIENGQVLAYSLFWIIGTETEILNIAVSPKFRRQSLGSKMIEYICSFSRENGSESVFLEVGAENEAAKKLYFSFGFEPIAIRKKYYIDEDAIVLRKNL